MHVNDLIMNIQADYKDCDGRLEKNYRREFELYSPSKLDDIWNAIQENHSYAKAPELGNIFKYMGLMGILRTKDLGIFYKRCTELKPELDYSGKPMFDSEGDPLMVECGAKYSLRSKFCPVCNHKRVLKNSDEIIINNFDVVKCNKLPPDLIVVNELCATCAIYHKDPTARGSKCIAWGTHDEYKKAGKKCKDCKCYDCCNEKPMNGIQHATLKIKRVEK